MSPETGNQDRRPHGAADGPKKKKRKGKKVNKKLRNDPFAKAMKIV